VSGKVKARIGSLASQTSVCVFSYEHHKGGRIIEVRSEHDMVRASGKTLRLGLTNVALITSKCKR
jgi:hypothetical protein